VHFAVDVSVTRAGPTGARFMKALASAVFQACNHVLGPVGLRLTRMSAPAAQT
jgi:hypothetical protein